MYDDYSEANGRVDASGPAYRALALQTTCRAVNSLTVADARGSISAAIERISAQVAASRRFIGDDTQLVVLPEYVLTGFPLRESIAEWIDKACLNPDGGEYKHLGAIARDNNIYLCGNAYETDPNFEGLYFQCCFVIDPAGEVVLRYRRLNSMFAPTPHDVWDRYLEIYGVDGVFPVADTPLGRLAPIASEEVLYPEIVRCFALRGAEVFVHSTSETGSPQETIKGIARKARAIENMAYVVSANTAGITGTAIPEASADGGSCIVSPEGTVLAEAGPGESMTAFAEIDVSVVRRARRRVGMNNVLARLRLEPLLAGYASRPSYPANTLAGGPPADRSHFTRTLAEVIAELEQRGTI